MYVFIRKYLGSFNIEFPKATVLSMPVSTAVSEIYKDDAMLNSVFSTASMAASTPIGSVLSANVLSNVLLSNAKVEQVKKNDPSVSKSTDGKLGLVPAINDSRVISLIGKCIYLLLCV